MKLTDEQREILAVCITCGSKLDPEKAGDAIEGGLRPGQLMCERCGSDPEYTAELMVRLGTLTAAHMAQERCREAGVFEEIEHRAACANRESRMRQSNEQN